ncbi:response regulator transcription factor [Cupriavidus sp.]|uniref:response regulator transcription factor n=1 Tax=Cupriavidus sp. TaxID=1873897 RepID=UPI0025C34C24|nr:response regulator transcription factor [Cupriavidus sp.]MCA3186555.1 response regulator transcription factor [Cupriavidus sp.]MCA3190701.1 response regulator transcription factor [Cupriavidus sp.]MCA3199212.1 response regulator transcription factor [Cupriavidus sp.]MCA3205149.1 response regulator transcription factor [Cupriavidus sp.]MCA3205821.1 response regulator transcription factor [Cupriavidus sp.]
MRILIVEDDPMLGDGMQRGLKLMGHAVDWFRTGADADRAVSAMHYDAVLLDLGLPDQDGVTLLSRWRTQGRQTPVVVLTARDAVQSRIGGLDAGADDYLIKPVDLDELAARLRAVTRRTAGMPEPVWRHGPLEYHPAARLAVWRGKSVDLTSRESMLLELLLAHPNRVLTREFLRDKLYEWEKGSESNTLEVHIHHLRRKIHPGIVRTLRGAGYTLGTLDALESLPPDSGNPGNNGDDA